MFGAAASAGLSPDAITGIVIAAVTVGVAAGALYRRRISKTRSRWRTEDDLTGYEDDRGLWHLGVVDTVDGWRDRDGNYHKGLTRRVEDLEHHTHGPDGTPQPRGVQNGR